MKLHVCRLGYALAILWALVVFLVGIANLIFPTYGVAFLQVIDSIYPGYHFGKWGFGGVLVSSAYAALDGFIMGIVFGTLYNLLIKGKKE